MEITKDTTQTEFSRELFAKLNAIVSRNSCDALAHLFLNLVRCGIAVTFDDACIFLRRALEVKVATPNDEIDSDKIIVQVAEETILISLTGELRKTAQDIISQICKKRVNWTY